MAGSSRTFRILSLDGGGTRGYLSASILRNIEGYVNRRDNNLTSLGQYFDLIAGTSTGGIIALALAIGIRAEDIVQFYNENLSKIFNPPNKWRKAAWFFRPKYESNVLSNCLNGLFGDKTLHDVKTDVCITSVSLQNAKPRLHKSDYLARNQARLDEKISDIALATSAAPTYFKAHSSKHSNNLVDGGMCANNPAMVALVEALQFERESKRGCSKAVSPDEVVMLSVGTGEQCSMPYNARNLSDGGLIDWIAVPLGEMPILEVFFQSQSQLIHFQTKFLLKAGYLRINPLLKFPMTLDDTVRVNELKNLADMTSEIESFINLYF